METVADILGDAPDAVATVPHIDAPRHPGQPALPPDGIYFGMPEEEYHSYHACSSTGLARMSVSSMDYWALSPLNLDRDEDEGSRTDGQISGKDLGKAYHCYICEGAVEFGRRYAVALDRDTCRLNAEAEGKKLCVTIADIRAAIDAEGIKPKGTSKEQLIEQLYDCDPGAHVWDKMVDDHLANHVGKTMISYKLFKRIAIAKAMIDNDPKLKDAFTGGHAEVSIFWHDEETGIPMKARLDYIKFLHLIDLKSFGNPQNKPIQRAIDMAISAKKYFIPVVVYLEAIEAAKRMIKAQKAKAITHYRGAVVERNGVKMVEPVRHPPTDPLMEWCWRWAHQPEPEVVFIFQQTGIAPVTRGRIMPKAGAYQTTLQAVRFLKRKWARCAKTYGVDPWIDTEPMVATVDESLTWAATDFGDLEWGENP